MKELSYVKLSDAESSERVALLDGWTIEDGLLAKTFSFPTYKDGVVFAGAVAFLADKLDHHPDLSIGYRKVRVAMSTHSVGGLSPFDFELAGRIDRL